jgi:hypothetical protein
MMMALAVLMLAFLQAPNFAQAQNKGDGSPLLVIKKGWARGRHRPDWHKPPESEPLKDIRNPNPIPDSNTKDEELNKRRKIPTSTEQYTYSATLKNVGEKTVIKVGWIYRFTEASGETSNHRFLNKIKIKPGKQKEVTGIAIAPPTRTLDADDGDKGTTGEVIVDYIEFEDGTGMVRKGMPPIKSQDDSN